MNQKQHLKERCDKAIFNIHKSFALKLYYFVDMATLFPAIIFEVSRDANPYRFDKYRNDGEFTGVVCAGKRTNYKKKCVGMKLRM